jgi:hypothetical protein
MAAMRIWIAGYGGPPAAAIGAIPVWIATGDGSIAGATEALIDAYGGPFGEATAVWIAGYGGPPPASIGAVPIFIGGYAGAGGSAPSHSAEALAYLARTVGGNEGGNAANIATLIDGLVSDGVWAKLDALYILAQQNQSDALLNLVGTSYTATILTLERGSTFVAYRGMNGGQWLTNFNAATAVSPHFTQNSASFGLWDTVNEFGSLMFGNGVDSGIWPHFSDGDFYARVNDLTSTGTPSSVLSGLYVGDRASGSAIHPFLNGADLGSVSSTAGVPASGNFTIGSASNPTDVVSAAFIGASLGAAGQLALYNRLRTYMTAVGVP